MITAMEMGKKISSESAYQMIKSEIKDLKLSRKQFKRGINEY